MTDGSSLGARRPRVGAALLALVLLTAACTSGSDPGAPDELTAPAVERAVTAVKAEDLPAERPATTSAQAPTVAVNPTSALADGLSALDAGYTFRSETTVNGQTAVVVEGRWLGGDSELTVASGDGAISYVFVGDRQWVRSPGGDWVEVDSSGPAGNPLAVLAGPLNLQLLDASPERVLMEGTYAGAEFDLNVAEVDVAILLAGGTLSEASFTVETDGNIAESRTVFEPLSDLSPITTPAS